MEEKDWPDFIKELCEQTNYDSYSECVNLAKEYEKQKERLRNNLGNFGAGTDLKEREKAKHHYEWRLKDLENEFKAKTTQVGKKFGVKEIQHEPELSKKQDDFLKRISDHKAKEASKNDAPPVVEDQGEAKAEQIRQIKAERERNRQIEQERGRDR